MNDDVAAERLSPAGKPQPKSRKKLWLVLAIGVPVGGLLLATLLGVGYFLLGKDLPITAKDMAAIVTAEDYVRAAGLDCVVDPGAATVSKRQYMMGETEWSYRYEVEDGPVAVICEIRVELTESEAEIGFGLSTDIASWMLMPSDVALQPCDHLFKWGDESSCNWLTVEGQAVGNVFFARKGKMTIVVTLAGGVLDDPAAIAGLMGPKLESAAALAQ
jgi:hypothetical protein